MIAVGCDHAGFILKRTVLDYLKSQGIECRVFQTFNEEEKVDYPVVAAQVAHSVASGECEKGILLCGTGVGVSIAANKVKGIRAAVCSEEYSCEYTRRHNDANILCMGGRVIDEATCLKLTKIFLNTQFEGGRHAARVDMYSKIENGEM